MLIYTPEVEQRLIELIVSGNSESQTAKALSDEFNLSITRNSVHSKLRSVNLNSLVTKPTTSLMPYFQKYIDYYEFGKEPEKKKLTLDSPYVYKNTKDMRVLNLNDLHVPFQIDEHIQEAVNKHRSSDLLVLSEVADCYSISRFNKEMSVPMEVEMDNVVRLLEYFSQSFPMVMILETNHSLRVEKQFQRSIPESLMFLVETHMLRRLSAPFSNIIVIPNWYVQINDALICHAETASKVDMKAAVNVYSFFTEWKKQLKLDDFRIIVQSHTHKLGTSYKSGGMVKIFESGCMCHMPQYAVSHMYGNPQVNGYINLVQKNGETDFNSTRENFLVTPEYKSGGKFYLG